MQVHIRHASSYGVARVALAPAESVQVATGAMMATSYGVAVAPKTSPANLVKSVTRSHSDSAVTTLTAPGQGGWVDVAPALPGDPHVLELDGRLGWCVARSSRLASVPTVLGDAQWSGFSTLFGGETGFLAHLTGQGQAVLCCYGAVDVLTLRAGEFVTIDTGHVVAYADTVQSRLRQLYQGVPQSMKTGEGLVFDFAGPGQVVTQTRSPRAFAGWLRHAGARS